MLWRLHPAISRSNCICTDPTPLFDTVLALPEIHRVARMPYKILTRLTRPGLELCKPSRLQSATENAICSGFLRPTRRDLTGERAASTGV